jgi:hypothetical protein
MVLPGSITPAAHPLRPARPAYLCVTNVFALLRLFPVSDRDKDVEILALRHQITVLERQLGTTRPRFCPGDRVFLAALLHWLPRDVVGRFRLLIRPDTVLRWHRDLMARRHAARSRPVVRVGRVPSAPSACWCCAWPGRTRAGVTGASTANCSCSASGSLPPPCGRSSARPVLTRRPSALLPPPGPVGCFMSIDMHHELHR